MKRNRSRRSLRISLLLFAALPLFARPAITSVVPDQGAVVGNETVTITGDDFIAPVTVRFGGMPVYEVNVVDAHTITVRTPAHLPGTVDIEVTSATGVNTHEFRFVGKASDAFLRLLVPVLVPPVHGAFGSEFRTELDVHNAGFDTADVFGLGYICAFECPPQDYLSQPVSLQGGQSYSEYQQHLNGTPGRFLYIAKAQAEAVGTRLRVYDVSREASNYGTEIHVVRESEFVETSGLIFPAVPTDARFRLTLRIYGAPEATEAYVFINDEPERVVLLRPGADLFEPAYAELSDFPRDGRPMRVQVWAPTPRLSPFITFPAVWAFFTVTNNDTQQITTITPH